MCIRGNNIGAGERLCRNSGGIGNSPPAPSPQPARSLLTCGAIVLRLAGQGTKRSRCAARRVGQVVNLSINYTVNQEE